MNSLPAKIWKLLQLPKLVQLLIMRFLQDQFLIGVTGIFFDNTQRVLLLKHTYRQTSWSLPGGYLKAKEHPAEGLEREIMEESGLVVSADRQLKTRTDRQTARLDLCYVGAFIGGEFKSSSEVSEYTLVAFDDLPMIPKNQLLLIQMALDKKNSF